MFVLQPKVCAKFFSNWDGMSFFILYLTELILDNASINCLVWSKSSERKMNKLNPQKDDIYEGLKSMKESKKLENNQRKLPIRIMPKRNKIDNCIKEIDGISQFNIPEFLLEV